MTRRLLLALLGMTAISAGAARAQNFDKLERDRAREMLHNIADDVRKHYYDPKLHAIDFDGRVREANERLQKAENLGQAFRIIAWALGGLDDSHTYFVPPPRAIRLDYGWRMQMVGEHCYVAHVRPKTDAEAKGLKPGDEILSVNGLAPTRDEFPTVEYIFNILSPQTALRLRLRGLDGQPRQIDVLSRVRQLQRLVDFSDGSQLFNFIREAENSQRMTRTRCEEINGQLTICKIPQFNLTEDQVNELMGMARKHQGLILDLRDNPGGSVETLRHLVGELFEHEVKIGDRVGRKEMKPEMAMPLHNPFTGKLVVLVDNQSASASELFARVIQLEKRGTVLGDRSAGLVMEGKFFSYTAGTTSLAFYAALITEADIIMSDGHSLEHRGVTPDEVLLPAATDLATGNDPVLARAAELFGVKISPAQAGKLFPYEWPPL